VVAGSVSEEAMESQQERRYVLEQSLIATLQHPITGVGPGQFSNYVGKLGQAAGKTGSALHWTETHNAFTQISSECGMPALIFFVGGMVLAFLSVNKTYGLARRRNHTELTNMCFCYLISMLPYVISIFFLANAYRFYATAMIGLGIAISAVGERELNAAAIVPVPVQGLTKRAPGRGTAMKSPDPGEFTRF
jgi:O-antigen ligase